MSTKSIRTEKKPPHTEGHAVKGHTVNPKQDYPGGQRALISFESGHYKTVEGDWKGDSVWTHFKKRGGGMVHVNKDKVEYIETWPLD